MAVSNGDQGQQYAVDSLVMPIPAGLMTPSGKLRLDFAYQDIYTSGDTTYQNGSIYSQVTLRRAASPGQPKGLGGGSGSYARQMQDTALFSGRLYDAIIATPLTRTGYLEIATLGNALVTRADGETGSAVPAARFITFMSGMDGPTNQDWSVDQELVLRPYWSCLSYRHMRGFLASATLTFTA